MLIFYTEIRNLDSDRKSLVYDNYSKLLTATSTIRRMRTNMDPLGPSTHTLSPAISHIAETAASLSSSMHALPQKPSGLGIDIQVEQERDPAEDRKRKQTETVRWVLDTPRRLQRLMDEEKEDEAEKEWQEVSRILAKWAHVPGVDALKQQCEAILQESDESGDSE